MNKQFLKIISLLIFLCNNINAQDIKKEIINQVFTNSNKNFIYTSISNYFTDELINSIEYNGVM